ncbi:hypothetical protein BGZ49_001276 [Haplosporangium sp. Z 27]|nr:hypothetical protein BGZ49_001276 [Haplosporangium sp. Z 27]
MELMGIVSGIFTLYIVPRLKDSGLKHGFGRGTQYLTILSLLKIKDSMLPVIAPGECVVAVLYWYLTLSDVYNIYPDGNRYIPFWIDFQMHGLPVLFVLAEMFYFSRHFKVRRFADVCFLSFFAVFYMAWSSFCAHMDGEWPYPILENLNCPWKRLRMMISSYLIYIACYLILSETHIRAKASRKFKHIIESAKETL